METIQLKDIVVRPKKSIVSLDRLLPIGDATVGEAGLVTVTVQGGVRSELFSTNEDVLIELFIQSNKQLTLNVGYINSQGETLYEENTSVSATTSDGKERFWKSFDAANLAVYKDAQQFFIQIQCEGANSFRIEKSIIRERDELERMSVYAENLEGIIHKIEHRLAELEYRAAANAENIVVSPAGNKFFVQVNDDGQLLTAPLIPNRVLFVGNSLLFGMEMRYGMCATKPENDYCHLVTEAIRAKNPDVIITRDHGARFEQLEDESGFDDLWSKNPSPVSDTPLGASFTPDLDLIIIQLAENVNNEKRYETFSKTVDRFLQLIRKSSPKARIVWVHGWWLNSKRDAIVADACRRHRIGCISISDLYSKRTIGQPGQTYEHADGSTSEAPSLWLGHPGDLGMKAIADRIIDYLKL